MTPLDKDRLWDLAHAHDIAEPYKAQGRDILLVANVLLELIPMINELIEVQRELSDKLTVMMAATAADMRKK